MKLLNIFNALKKTGKTVHKSIKGSMKFMDEVLEKEYIVNTIDDIKEATGKVVEKSGEIYENTIHSVESLTSDLRDKAEEFKDEFKEIVDEEE